MKLALSNIFENGNALQPKPPRTHLQLNKLRLLLIAVRENVHHEGQGGHLSKRVLERTYYRIWAVVR